MKFFRHVKATTSSFLFVLVCVSCTGKSDIYSSVTEKSSKHFSMGKPVAPIELTSSPVIYIDKDKEVFTDVEIETATLAGVMDIVFLTTDGLTLIDTDAHQSRELSASSSLKIPVKLRANANGRYYLNMHIRLHQGETNVARVLALIVQVGAETQPTLQLKKTSEENIIRLPAQEEISRQ